MKTLQYSDFKAYSIVDDPTKLPPGTLIKSSKNVDLTRSLGAMAKRLGTEAQFLLNLLGTDGNCEDLSKWNNYGGGSVITLDSDNAKYGSKAIKIAVPASGQQFAGITNTEFVNKLKAGRCYIALTDLKNGNLSSGLYFRISGVSGNSQVITASTYQTVYMKFIGSGAITDVAVISDGSETSANQYGYVDGVRIFEIPKEIYDKIDVDPEYTGNALAQKFPYIDTPAGLLSTTGTKGTHTYRRSSGDRPLFVVGTDLYRLSGATQTLTKTTTADYDAGTKDSNVSTADNEIKLIKTGFEVVDQKQEESDAGYNSIAGQTFTPQVSGISAIEVYTGSYSGTKTLTLYDSPAKGQVLGTATATGTSIANWRKFVFPNIVTVTKGLSGYYIEINAYVSISTTNKYSGGQMYQNGVAQANYDMQFRVYGSDSFYTTGKWISPVYDLGSTPLTSAISWTKNTPAGTSVTVKVRGGNTSQDLGDYQTISASGGGIPLTRFVQVEVALTGSGTTPSLQDLTLTYETESSQPSVIKSGLSGNKVRFVDYKDVCYFVDGGRPQRYDGTNIRNVGVDPPASAPTLAASGTGLTGEYKEGWTFVNEYGSESNMGPTATITLTNQGIQSSSIPVGPAGTTARKKYRTKAGGSIYYYVTTINDNTTTTYNDTTADANLITPLESDNNIPPNSTIVLEHNNYMLYVVGDKLYHSKPGQPDSVPSTAYKKFPGNIMGAEVYQGAVVVGGDSFTSVVYGDIWDKDPDIDNTRIETISKEYGPLSHEAMQVCMSEVHGGDILIFPTRQGLNYLSPGLQDDTMRSTPLSRDVQPFFDGAVNKANMTAVFDRYRYILALNYYGTDTPVQYNNTVLVYDLRTGQWSPPWDLSVAGFCISNGKVLFGSSVKGCLYELDKGTSDDGQSIECIRVLNLDYTPYGPHKKKKMKNLYVGVAENSKTANLEFWPYVDGKTLPSALTLGDTSTWKGLVSPKKRIGLAKGSVFQWIIKDTSTDDSIITDITTEYQRTG